MEVIFHIVVSRKSCFEDERYDILVERLRDGNSFIQQNSVWALSALNKFIKVHGCFLILSSNENTSTERIKGKSCLVLGKVPRQCGPSDDTQREGSSSSLERSP